MAGPYTIQTPVSEQPISSSLFGLPVKLAIEDLHLRALTLETNQQAMVGRGRRITSKSVAAGSAGTEFGYMRVDNVPVRAGGVYRIMTSGMNMDTDVANDVMWARIRVAFAATPGTFATTASTSIGSMRNLQANISQSNIIPFSCFYFSAGDGFASFIVTAQRIAGTGSLNVSHSGTEPFDLTIEYSGPDPGDTAVLL
ncbi:MAG: hypothetical protein ABW022_11095 [Actinoplanes sp.]